MFLLLILMGCSEDSQYKGIEWGTSKEEVKKIESLELLNESDKELEYKYNTNLVEEAVLRYSFDANHNGLINRVVEYDFNNEQNEDRLKNLNLVYEKLETEYGTGRYTKDSEFQGYSWAVDDTYIRVVLSEGTKGSVFVIYYDYEHYKAILNNN
ncbi:hypothetical protein ACK8P5_08750 [Paenibacillus sp. EC2-1]|uniref:hypothetical protein n=1 Tax=Paenibacillus sp. EC2-1 TaxID=3388665 RepID=UPI003BEEBA8C